MKRKMMNDDEGKGSGRRRRPRLNDWTVVDEEGRTIPGVGRTKSGKYDCKITDPFKKKMVWIGTFSTVEAAVEARLAKEREFDLARQRGIDPPAPGHVSRGIEWVEVFEKEPPAALPEEEEEPVLVDSQIPNDNNNSPDDCATNVELNHTYWNYSEPTQNYLGSDEEFATHKTIHRPSSCPPDHDEPTTEESSQTVSERPKPVIVSCETLKEKLNVVSVTSTEYNGGGALGYFVPSPNDGSSGSMIFVPIIDNHGFLLGEFGKIDDLEEHHS
ncbi:OLC1v1020627C1 [Oldenlandia corymbosa var. corymbosa]|uniref:OLC1v1020627C1 n=1 Tax=Oldenlandia corymbosa var. corymbosa TaxID=529605 RepID=A0AAV1EGW0_OLDCO|nr:OLC1v1020627C1 [Oldenlandia corymbosa var. corymbosa]